MTEQEKETLAEALAAQERPELFSGCELQNIVRRLDLLVYQQKYKVPSRPMKAENAVFVNFSLYDYGAGTALPHPRAFYATIEPKPVGIKWVGQSLGDSIWVLYEFGGAEEKERFLANLPAEFVHASINAHEEQAFYDHWAS